MLLPSIITRLTFPSIISSDNIARFIFGFRFTVRTLMRHGFYDILKFFCSSRICKINSSYYGLTGLNYLKFFFLLAGCVRVLGRGVSNE